MKQGAWSRLDYEVKFLIVKLAYGQGFKCANCDRNRGLEIEHDHEPEHGPSDRYTVYNIRGLSCRRCNQHIGLYEADLRGEDRGWDHVFLSISESEYNNYIDAYECRVYPLIETAREERLGSKNYWRRRRLLLEFDHWKLWGGRKGRYPWYWGFEEIKEKRRRRIRTPQQFFEGLLALMKFVVEELKKDPDFRPPEKFIDLLVRLKPLMDEIGPIAEARLKALAQTDSAQLPA